MASHANFRNPDLTRERLVEIKACASRVRWGKPDAKEKAAEIMRAAWKRRKKRERAAKAEQALSRAGFVWPPQPC